MPVFKQATATTDDEKNGMGSETDVISEKRLLDVKPVPAKRTLNQFMMAVKQ